MKLTMWMIMCGNIYISVNIPLQTNKRCNIVKHHFSYFHFHYQLLVHLIFIKKTSPLLTIIRMLGFHAQYTSLIGSIFLIKLNIDFITKNACDNFRWNALELFWQHDTTKQVFIESQKSYLFNACLVQNSLNTQMSSLLFTAFKSSFPKSK